MKKLLALAYVMTFPSLLWATQELDCDFVKRSIKDLETEISRARPNNESCTLLTAQQVGLTSALTPEQQTTFDRIKCQPLALTEMDLAQNENKLLLSDGLRELRTRTTSTQNQLARVRVWNQPQLDQLSHFREDVLLGALVQEALRTNVVGEILTATAASASDPATADWTDNLKDYCTAHAAPKPSICSVVDTIGDADIQEFGNFLATIRPLGALTSAQSQEFANLMQISSNGQVTDFKSVNQVLNNANFSTTPGVRPTLSQVTALRSLALGNVPSTSINAVSGWVQRWNQKIQREAGEVTANLGGEVGSPSNIRQGFEANGERHFLRARARWSQLWSRFHPNDENPCVGDQAVSSTSFKSCVAARSAELVALAATNGRDDETQRMLGSINASLDIVQRNHDLAQLCAADGAPAATPPAQCLVSDQDQLKAEQEHQVLKAVRDFLAQQQTRQLQTRSFLASQWASQQCSGAGGPFEGDVARCVGAQLLNFPALSSFTQGNFQILIEASGGGTPEMNDEICANATGAVRPVCDVVLRPVVAPVTPNPTSSSLPRVTRRTESRYQSSTNRLVNNALINQAIVGAITNVGGQLINNPLNISNFQTGLQMMYATPTLPVIPAYSTPFANLWNAPWSSPIGVNYTSSDLFRMNWGLPQLNTGASSSVSNSLFFGSAGSTSLSASNIPGFAF